MPTDWDPVQYNKFVEARSRPFYDLVALITPSNLGRAVDLGCGTGSLTRDAVRSLDIASAVGVDSSLAMLADAAPMAIPSRLRFELGDISTWTSGSDHDLVLANASLQWVPDHPGVLERWTLALAPGGQLAVQVPFNHDHAAHVVADELRLSEPFNAFDVAPDPVAENVLAPEAYSQLLYDLGYEHQHVHLRVYDHLMPSTLSVVEWVKGTTLTRFRTALPADLYDEFEARYSDRLVKVLGNRAPYFYPFKRILLWGRLPSVG